jgi:hypothetical protein
MANLSDYAAYRMSGIFVPFKCATQWDSIDVPTNRIPLRYSDVREAGTISHECIDAMRAWTDQRREACVKGVRGFRIAKNQR